MMATITDAEVAGLQSTLRDPTQTQVFESALVAGLASFIGVPFETTENGMVVNSGGAAGQPAGAAPDIGAPGAANAAAGAANTDTAEAAVAEGSSNVALLALLVVVIVLVC